MSLRGMNSNQAKRDNILQNTPSNSELKSLKSLTAFASNNSGCSNHNKNLKLVSRSESGQKHNSTKEVGQVSLKKMQGMQTNEKLIQIPSEPTTNHITISKGCNSNNQTAAGKIGRGQTN